MPFLLEHCVLDDHVLHSLCVGVFAVASLLRFGGSSRLVEHCKESRGTFWMARPRESAAVCRKTK